MNTAVVILTIKKKVAEQGEVSLRSMGLLDDHIAQVVEQMKDEKNYEIVFHENDTIIKKKTNQDLLLSEAALNPQYQHNPPYSRTKKEIVQKTGLWIASHIVQIIIGLLIAFLVFKLGWN